MKLKYLTESSYEQLYKGVGRNMELYKAEEFEFEKIFHQGVIAKESNVVVNDFSLFENSYDVKDDIVNVRLLYTALKKLTPEQASSVYLWTWLAHGVFYKYIKNRWDPTSESTIKDRYFCDSYAGSRIGLFRNGISRLWWYGYLTYQENQSNPFKLTELLLSNSDLCLSLVERKFSMNRNIIIGILNAIATINDSSEYENVVMDEWRSLAKYLNRYGAVSMLDFLSSDEICEISLKYILESRNKK